MKKFKPALNVEQICQITGAVYQGEENLVFDNACEPSDATSSSVIFWEQEKMFETVQNSGAGLIICPPQEAHRLPGRNLLLSPRPYFTLMSLVAWWLNEATDKPAPGIHPSAVVDPTASLGDGVSIGALARIGKNVKIGAGSVIGDGCQIENNVSVGKSCRLYPRVTVYEDCVIGSGVIIHSGVVIGADGFGFMLLDGKQQKIPQIGNVVIEDNVEIGANTTIDRATLGSTVIGAGSKLDNLVQVGHNCKIGHHCILCAQVGLAGSTILGDYVYLAGQVGVAGHLTIGDRAMVGAQSGVANNVPPDARYMGYPADDANLTKRVFASQKHLPEIYRHYLRQIKSEKEEQ